MESGTGLDDTGTEKNSASRSYSTPYWHIAFTFGEGAQKKGGKKKKKKEKNLLKARAKSSTESLMPMDSMMPPSAGA